MSNVYKDLSVLMVTQYDFSGLGPWLFGGLIALGMSFSTHVVIALTLRLSQ